ncbi:MAG: hypothetical protein B1H07_03330 [Campylobacteraceae bacterium 4484_166]|nr:MAG: hypothetical protein B1H07_03330 [Campylobacteraceae bacterium 4484_166]
MKKIIKTYIQTKILPYIIACLIRLIYITNKKVFLFKTKPPKEPFVLTMWHGQLLFQPLNYRKYKPKGIVKVIVSEHRDGQTIRKIVNYLGVGDIQGSSTRGGAKALIKAIKSIKNGIDVAITPDGPRGPVHEISDGIVAIAQKTGAKIVACSIYPSKFWQLNSWDSFLIPKPFGKILFKMSEPFDIDKLSSQEAKNKIKNKMMENLYEK